MFSILTCASFWIVMVAAAPRGNGVSLALALAAMGVSVVCHLTDRSAA